MGQLEQISKMLATAVAKAVVKSPPPEPVYAVVVQYYGTDVYDDDILPDVRMPAESRRLALLQEKGESAPYYIWCHDEFDDDRPVYDLGLNAPELHQTWMKLQQRLIEGKLELAVIRKLTQNACRLLNKAKWPPRFLKTEDFVAYAADMAHEFYDTKGHMNSSIPKSKMALLRDNGYLEADQ